MKNALVIYYTQSGQLLDIAKSVTQDLEKATDVTLSFYNIQLEGNFLFPWKKSTFFDAFPESFLQIPCALKDLDNPILQKKYDLIIFAYQVWYLTPSIPINSFLKSNISKQIFEDTPVITVIGCRNMWIMAQEKMKKLLSNNNANLVGNIVLADKHINHISVITISQWMFSGIKKKYLGIFPKPGVSTQDIKEASRFGKTILSALKTSDYANLQEALVNQNAVKIKPFLVLVDKRANLLFSKWANFIIKKGKAKDPKRTFWVKLFYYYLLFAIWIIAPLVFIVHLLTYPFLFLNINKNKKYYSSIEMK